MLAFWQEYGTRSLPNCLFRQLVRELTRRFDLMNAALID